MPKRQRPLDEDAADVGEPTLNVMLDTPVIAPQCFSKPERCDVCRDCGLRLLCYERHAERAAVHLLPRPRLPK